MEVAVGSRNRPSALRKALAYERGLASDLARPCLSQLPASSTTRGMFTLARVFQSLAQRKHDLDAGVYALVAGWISI